MVSLSNQVRQADHVYFQMTIKQALIDSVQQLQKAKIPSAHLDADILLAHILGKPKEFLYAQPEYKLPKSIEMLHATSLQRRLNREPIAYIINKKEFYGLDFFVDKRVLIPRPETEKIVNDVIKKIKKLKIKNCPPALQAKALRAGNLKLKIIDVGAGTGCIIISIIKELLKSISNFQFPISNYTFIATDISADALAVAKINAKKHKVDHLIKFYQGDLLKPIIKSFPKLFTFHFSLFTFITANLPYITPEKYLTLEPEIKKHEPKLALLASQNDADYYYKKLDRQIDELQKMTKAKIWRFCEYPV